MQSKVIYNFFAATEDWIVRPALSYVADYVKKNPKFLVELDRHGHLSIMSSHRIVSFIRDYIIESCTALLSPVTQADKDKIAETVARVEEELDDSDFIFVGKDEVDDTSHKIVEESDNEGAYVLIDYEEERSSTPMC